MSTGKPPQPPKKTLIGMPSDMQAAIAQLQAKQKGQQPSAAPAAPVRPPAAAPVPAMDLQRTLYGNPHDTGPVQVPAVVSRPQPAQEPLAPQVVQRPPLPSQRPGMTPQAPAPQARPAEMQRTRLDSGPVAAPQARPAEMQRTRLDSGPVAAPQARPAEMQRTRLDSGPVAAPQAPSLQRTMLGTPSDMAELMRQPLGQGHAAAPTPNAPTITPQRIIATGTPQRSAPPAAAWPAQQEASAFGQQAPLHGAAQSPAAPGWPPSPRDGVWSGNPAAAPALPVSPQPQSKPDTSRSGVHPSGAPGRDAAQAPSAGWPPAYPPEAAHAPASAPYAHGAPKPLPPQGGSFPPGYPQGGNMPKAQAQAESAASPARADSASARVPSGPPPLKTQAAVAAATGQNKAPLNASPAKVTSALDSTEPDRAEARAAPGDPKKSVVHSGKTAGVVSAKPATGVALPKGTANVPVATHTAAKGATSLAPSLGALPGAVPPSPMQATRLVAFEPGALVSQSTSGTGEVPRLSGELAPSERLSLGIGPEAVPVPKPAPVKRWPAIALLGLAVVAAFAVVALRAPGLLPAPLAALFAPPPPPPAPELPQANVVDPNAPQVEGAPGEVPGQPAPGVAQVGADPAAPAPTAPGAELAAVPGSSSPTSPPQAQATPPTAATATGVAVQPAAIAPAAAELEKRAIESLLANDLAAARQLYEQLRASDVNRPEYAIMLELLTRETAPPCGGPGQPACAQ